MGILLDVAKDLFGDGIGKLAGLLPHEGSAPCVCPQSAKFIAAGLHQLLVVVLLAMNVLDSVVAHLVQLHHTGGEVAQAVPGPELTFGVEERTVAFSLLVVALFVFRSTPFCHRPR